MTQATSRSRRRLLEALAVGLVLLAGVAPAVSAAGPDPALGKWYGIAGAADNQSPFGLELKARANDEIAATLYLEVMSWFGEELPPAKRDGNRIAIPEVGIDLILEGDRLSGTMGKAPVSLTRAATLPTEPPLPDTPKGPAPRWTTPMGGAIYATAAVRDGIAYVGTSGGVFNAVKVTDGSFAWTFSAGRPIMGEALTTDDAVFFVCDNGFLFKLNRATGKETWRYDLGDGQVSRILPHQIVYDYDHDSPMPVLADGVLYVGSGDGSVHAVNATTGQRVWRVGTKGKVRSTALVIGAHVIIGDLGGELRKLDRATGREVWMKDLKGAVTSAPALVGGRLVIGTRGSALIGLDLETGERQWVSGFWGSWVESTAVEGGDGLGYIGSSDLRRITSFDPKDGRILWRTDVYGAPWGKPLVTEKYVYDGASAIVPYMTRHSGGLVALDRKTGKLAWRFPLTNPPGTLHYGFATSPARAGDTLVIGGMDGVLYAFPLI